MSEAIESVSAPPMPPMEGEETVMVETPDEGMPVIEETLEGEESPGGNFSRGLQREQRRRAELERTVAEMRESLSALQQARSAAPLAPDELDEIEATLNADSDAVMPGYSKAIKALITRVRKAEKSQNAGLDPSVRADLDLIKFNSFMAPYPAEYKDAYVKAQQGAYDKGRRGEALSGYMTAWWENFIASKSEASPEPVRTTSGGAKRGVIPSNAVRKSQAATNEQLLAERHRKAGGNILGLDLKNVR